MQTLDCRDTSFSPTRRPRCLTLVLAFDTRATLYLPAAAQKAQGYTVGSCLLQAVTWKPAFIHEQPTGRHKRLSCNCTLLHSVTDVQPWSSSRAWAGAWVSSECAHTAPPNEGGASGLHSRCPGGQAAESRCGQAAPALAQAGDSMRSIHGGVSRASRNAEEAFRRGIPIVSPISLFAF